MKRSPKPSDTPRTDYAFGGDLDVGVLPGVTTWEQAKGFARMLERELNKARLYSLELSETIRQLRAELNEHSPS